MWAADWRVYLHLPAAHAPDDIDSALGRALTLGAIGAVEIPLTGLGDQDAAALVDHFRAIVHPTGIPLIGFGKARRDILARLDGVRHASLEEAKQTKSIGDLTGITVGDNRDDAMTAGTQRPDFLYLDAPAEFVAWWSEVMIVPCVAPIGDRLSDGAAMLKARPDMVALDEAA
ncbi:MAG: hypothetical protein AAGC83_14630, partial [Pseudomonadota bacterium]